MQELLSGTVKEVLVTGNEGFRTVSQSKLKVYFDGLEGDKHRGMNTFLGFREKSLREHNLPKGMPIRNLYQFSMISVEEMKMIQDQLELGRSIPSGLLGENIIVEGIRDLSNLPRGTILLFSDPDGSPRTTVLGVWDQNTPCSKPGKLIQSEFPEKSHLLSERFVEAAWGKRGVLGFVISPGLIYPGDTMTIVYPPDSQDI